VVNDLGGGAFGGGKPSARAADLVVDGKENKRVFDTMSLTISHRDSQEWWKSGCEL
jgi:hypothetical protein